MDVVTRHPEGSQAKPQDIVLGKPYPEALNISEMAFIQGIGASRKENSPKTILGSN